MIIDKTVLTGYDNRYRAILLNSLAGIKQAVLIGTNSFDGISNLAIFNSLIHLGANPPLWGFICRPDNASRHTLRNILETQHYTINYVSIVHYKNAHQTSAKYNEYQSEFENCGFSEHFTDGFNAPFVAEAHIKVGMKFVQKLDIAVNGTTLVIGSIDTIDLNENNISDDGFVDLSKEESLLCSGLDAYYESKLIERLSYARPGEEPKGLRF